MPRMVFSVLTLAALAAAAMAATPATFRGHQFAREARISLTRARVIALKARPGIVADQQLDKESGGSGLRYSFDIFSAGKMFEVGVDAETGKVLENGVESAVDGEAES
jgi:uncharacterized membrane protein YkoI